MVTDRSPAELPRVDIRAIPLCIICAKQEEMGKIASAFCLGQDDWYSSEQVHGPIASNGVYAGRFRANNGGEIPFFITCCSRQGIQTFGIEASALFTAVRPKYALLIGTCAARKGQGLDMGNVIFGQCALNYEEGKVHVGEDGIADFKPDAFPLHPKASETVNLSLFVTGSDQSRYKCGDFASGCAVRLDAQNILDRVARDIKRSVLGLEMEASAYIQACNLTGGKSLGIVKGVSDPGDFRKGADDDKNWHLAISNAAEAAKRWVTSNIRFDQSTQEEQPGIKAAKTYFKGYIHSVNKCRHDLWLRSGTIDGGAKGLKAVLPKQNDVNLYGGEDTTISQAVREYGITCVCTGSDSDVRTALFKAQYLVDFPRILHNSLAGCRDATHQADLFETCLKQLCEQMAFPDKVQILTWEQFVDWAR